MSDFEKLLGELDDLDAQAAEMRKALESGADETDEQIQAAADAGDGAGGEGEGADDGKKAGDGEGAGEGEGGEAEEGLGKSFMIELENGEKVEAFDGTKMLKSLQAKVAASDQRYTELEQRSTEALEKATGLIKQQSEMLKSLQTTVQELQNAGRGRKAVITMADGGNGQPLKKSEELTGPQFMAKALEAQGKGLVTGHQVALMESYLNRGTAIPQDLVDKVLQ